MKNKLIITILLLTLYPYMSNFNVSVIFAQNFAYENGSYWLPDIVVSGTDHSKIECDCCHDKFDDDEKFQRHLNYNFVCQMYYDDSDDSENDEGNDNGNVDNNDYGYNGTNFCAYCNQPYDYCGCNDIIVTGNGQSANDIWEIITEVDVNPESDSVDVDVEIDNNINEDYIEVGGYYKAKSDCQKLFLDSILIPPLQPEKTTCVSTSLAYAVLWLENLPVEKFDSVKIDIEAKYFERYRHNLSQSGVPDSVLQDFLMIHSGVNVQPISLTQLKTKILQGYSGLGTLVIKRKDGTLGGHEISIVGYDYCKEKFICKDPEKMELVYLSEEELNAYNSIHWNRNSIFYIERNF